MGFSLFSVQGWERWGTFEILTHAQMEAVSVSLFVLFLRQALTMQFKLPLSLILLKALLLKTGITSMYHHSWMEAIFLK
jgi:hypothetical protein